MNHDKNPSTDEAGLRYQQVRRVTIIGGIADFFLGITKITIGWLAHSQALIADGIHSLSDLLTDVMVLVASKYASEHADAEHPYGHARIETMATFLLALSLGGVAFGIAWNAIGRLFNAEALQQPGLLALAVAAVSVITKEAIFHYSLHVAKKVRSNMLRANAWHSRSDALSSIIVMIGVGGTMAGLFYLDAIAAVLVALMIAKMAWDFGRQSATELIDTAIDEEQRQRIENTILSIDGVNAVHALRTRRMGANTLLDTHVLVNSTFSVSEAHYIGTQVHNTLLQKMEEVRDVVVHIDPEDDQEHTPNLDLPLRANLIEELREYWRNIPAAEQIDNVVLHYLRGQIHVELRLPFSTLDGADSDTAKNLSAQFKEALLKHPHVATVQVLFYETD